jgi:protease I
LTGINAIAGSRSTLRVFPPPTDATPMRALIVSADGFEDSELRVPLLGLRQEGIAVEVASIRPGRIRGKHGDEVEVDRLLEEVRPEEYDLLVLPGGKAPALLRGERKALEIARAFMAANKPVAAICHGPQILVSAGVLRGRRATCYHTVAAELRNAGALYEDREVVLDGNLVTARQPADLPAFMRATIGRVRAAEAAQGPRAG